jgi:antitoxin HicB
MTKYSFTLHWSDEDEGYIVKCPEFSGLSAFGDSPDEALAEAQIALELMIETYQESGYELPEPRKLEQYSGQFRERIPKTLHRQAAELADYEGVSLNAFVSTAIAERVGAQAAIKPSGQTATHKRIVFYSVAAVTTGPMSGGLCPVMQLRISDLGEADKATTAIVPANELVN